jgi:MotA/TolQ/ExbB proton channel family protein
MRLPNRARSGVDSRRSLMLLKGLLLWTAAGTAFLAAWHCGLLRRVWTADSTGLSAAITLVFLGVAAHGSWHVLRLSRALNHVMDVQDAIATAAEVSVEASQSARIDDLPTGCVREYIQGLRTRAKIVGRRAVLDQNLLLEAFEADLRRGHDLGRLVADLLLSLGLLGSVLGLGLMLGPLIHLFAYGLSALGDRLAAISGGMAVALYTTLAGLIGGTLLKLQGFLLDAAVQELVRRTTRLTEIYILPPIERSRSDPAA